MFDIVSKQQLWDAWDREIHNDLASDRRFQLKVIQDTVVYDQLKDIKDKDIAEIGGGGSRILRRLNKDNRCRNIEKFEGEHGGPDGVVTIENVENVYVFLGEFSPELKDESLDVIFSISVIEHVPDDALEDFFQDGMRILRPGGLWIHAIDLYLSNNPGKITRERFEAYRKWMTNGQLTPTGNVYEGPLKFSCEMATNPDDEMYRWNQAAPQYKQSRLSNQSVSILLAGRKNIESP